MEPFSTPATLKVNKEDDFDVRKMYSPEIDKYHGRFSAAKAIPEAKATDTEFPPSQKDLAERVWQNPRHVESRVWATSGNPWFKKEDGTYERPSDVKGEEETTIASLLNALRNMVK